ncbi:PucR family transcriptional regulator [Actinopolyspora halophila]|uniref:PucR family transcriptional regulator n=1 Tax=Actinopolyspora halophila TaxID=1850 RepID=UPI00036B75F9|nr:PucR family transcriptional regulator [Actinopolyspora halophila]
MVKLDRLITVLGGYGVRLAGTGAARETELRSVAMHDPTDDSPAVGDVFLAVGVESPERAAELAAAAHAVVVLLRGDSAAADGINRVCGQHEVTPLVVDPAVSWSQLAEVVYGLVFEGRETEAGRGPSDLFALADTVAAAVKGSVTIEDRLSRVMAYSSLQHEVDSARHETILGRRVPEAIRRLFTERGVFAHLSVSDEPLFVPTSPSHGLGGRMVIAVRAGREFLGSLWVACDAPLSEQRARVLRDSAHTVASHLLRSRVSADLERQVESELVIQLVEAGPDTTTALGKLGVGPGPFRVIALQAHAHGERHAAVLLAFERATTGFGWSRPGRSALFGNTVYTILPSDEDPAAARDWLHTIITSLPEHVTITAGIGAPATPSQLPTSRNEADESLALHTARPDDAPISYDESWDRILLQRLRTAAASGRVPPRGPLADLARHDAAHATDYLSTLHAWLRAQANLTVAAERLDVHPNTVRYRIRRMRRITDLRLDDPDERLAMLIALATDAERA